MMYHNFDLELTGYDPATLKFQVRLTACDLIDPQKASAAHQVQLPSNLRDTQAALAYGELNQRQMIEFGTALADCLLPTGLVNANTIRQLLSDARREADRQAIADELHGIRIRLRIDNTELADIAWEYTYIKDPNTRDDQQGMEGFIALDPGYSIVRAETLTGVAAPKFPALGPNEKIRLVALTVNPPNVTALNLDQEVAALREALDEIKDRVQAEVYPNETLKWVTRDVLQKKVIENQGLHVLHFAGHGYFTKQLGAVEGTTVGEGGLVFVDDAGDVDLISAATLALLLKRRKLRLVVLSACQGATRDQVNAWSGIAPALIRAEIPAVVGMQTPISDPAAIAFSKAFYASVAAGNSVDDAVREARLAIFSDSRVDADKRMQEWGIAALYLRAKDDLVLFPRQSTAPTTAVIQPQSGNNPSPTSSSTSSSPNPTPNIPMNINKTALRDFIKNNFDDRQGDFDTLCATLTDLLKANGINDVVDPGLVGGNNRAILALNLVNYCDRRGYIAYLAEAARRERPTVSANF